MPIFKSTRSVDDAIGGFSYGWTSNYRGNQERTDGAIYLPYPYYNDDGLVNQLLDTPAALTVGKWHKKAATPEPIALIVSFVLFLLAPTWQKLYDARVQPYLTAVIAKLKEKAFDRFQYHYGFHLRDEQGRTVSVYLIPLQQEALYLSQVASLKGGLEAAMAYLATNDLAKARGVYLLKMQYDSRVGGDVVLSAQFCDGTAEWYGK